MTDAVDRISARLAPLERDANLGWWDAAVTAGPETERRRVDTSLALGDALADSDAFAELEAAGGRRAADRRVVVLHAAHAPEQVDADLRRRIVETTASVEATFATHRGTIAGEPVDDNSLLAVLATSTDEGERRAAWEAAKSVGAEVADRVRALARLRNEAARRLGHRDHFALALATEELDEARLLGTLDAVAGTTEAPFAEWKETLDAALRERFGLVGDPQAWHLEDPFFQEAPRLASVDLDPWLAGADVVALAQRTFDGLGFDVAPVLAASDLEPRAGKNQHAFCLHVDRGADVRVLANVEPDARWAETMLHELGHAVYFTGLGEDLPWALRTMHSLTTEAVAMLLGRLVHDPEWLTTIAGVPRAEVEARAADLRAAGRAQRLVFARWALVMVHFERALYADPDGDLDGHWWDLVERYQRVPRPAGRRAPDWASKIHVAVAPVYYQHYLYGELLASQLEAALRTVGPLLAPASGRTLAERVFRPGHARRWDAVVEEATGRPLSPAAFAAELGS